jgi:hypothetical protein
VRRGCRNSRRVEDQDEGDQICRGEWWGRRRLVKKTKNDSFIWGTGPRRSRPFGVDGEVTITRSQRRPRFNSSILICAGDRDNDVLRRQIYTTWWILRNSSRLLAERIHLLIQFAKQARSFITPNVYYSLCHIFKKLPLYKSLIRHEKNKNNMLLYSFGSRVAWMSPWDLLLFWTSILFSNTKCDSHGHCFDWKHFFDERTHSVEI